MFNWSNYTFFSKTIGLIWLLKNLFKAFKCKKKIKVKFKDVLLNGIFLIPQKGLIPVKSNSQRQHRIHRFPLFYFFNVIPKHIMMYHFKKFISTACVKHAFSLTSSFIMHKSSSWSYWDEKKNKNSSPPSGLICRMTTLGARPWTGGHSIVLGVRNVGLKFPRLSREVNQVFLLQDYHLNTWDIL